MGTVKNARKGIRPRGPLSDGPGFYSGGDGMQAFQFDFALVLVIVSSVKHAIERLNKLYPLQSLD